MNVKIARKTVEKLGIEVAVVIANDDVCSAPFAEQEKRRGVAGEIFSHVNSSGKGIAWRKP